jgi:hypothetical protein
VLIGLRAGTCCAVATLAALGGLSAADGPDARGASTPRCFGAAARDPRHPCANPRLRDAVHPSPADAVITPNAPCVRQRLPGLVHPCEFGTPAAQARGTIALIGDSHAAHWRAALEPVTLASHQLGLSAVRSICAVSAAIKRLSPAGVDTCRRWNREVVAWLTAHPEIHTVFQSQIISHVGVVTAPGQSDFAAEVAGYKRRWRTFPASVRHIIVIRDTPQWPSRNMDCISRARRRHRPPGAACARPRTSALPPDPAAVAASTVHSRRVQLVDLTPFFCDATRCYPVVGGVLVHKDSTHLTRLYATTLGPYLLRAVRNLMRAWRP